MITETVRKHGRKDIYVDSVGSGPIRRPDPKYHKGNYCPRCLNGIIILDSLKDICCLQCGWRVSYYKGLGDIKNETSPALLAKLIYNNTNIAPV